MSNQSVVGEVARLWAPENLKKSAPGILLCCAIAAIAFVANANGWMKFGRVMIPPLIVTLVIGMCLQPLSSRDVLKPGLDFSGRTLLRLGVALYGAQLTLGQLVHGGALPVVIAIAAVSCTIAFGAIVARMFGLTRDFADGATSRQYMTRRIECTPNDATSLNADARAAGSRKSRGASKLVTWP